RAKADAGQGNRPTPARKEAEAEFRTDVDTLGGAYRDDPEVTGSRSNTYSTRAVMSASSWAASSLSMAAVIRRSTATDLDGVSGCLNRHLSSIFTCHSVTWRRNEVPL